jgi:hypothetical protein
MPATPEQFKIDVSKWVDGAKDKLRRFAIEFVQDVAQEIVEVTPWKTGNLRASWYATINDSGSAPAGGIGDVASLGLVAANLKLGDVYRMQNGAVYAMRVEFGFVGLDSLGRHYNQAPRAFVRNTLARADTIAAATAAKIAAEPTIK